MKKGTTNKQNVKKGTTNKQNVKKGLPAVIKEHVKSPKRKLAEDLEVCEEILMKESMSGNSNAEFALAVDSVDNVITFGTVTEIFVDAID